jgi:O-antigen ligase
LEKYLNTLRDVLTTKKTVRVLFFAMVVGLFLQLTGKIFYTSGSANGAHVYLFLIIPSLITSIFFTLKYRCFFSRDVVVFLLASMAFMVWSAITAEWGDGDFSFVELLKRSIVIVVYMLGVILLMGLASVHQVRLFLLLAIAVVAIGVVFSLYYQFSVLDKSFGWRTFRLSSMGYNDWVDLGNPVIAGLYMGLFAICALALTALEKQLSLYLVIVFFALLLTYIFLTFSRTAWVAGCVSAIFLWYCFRNRTFTLVGVAVALAFLLLAGTYFDEFLLEITKKQLSRRDETWLWALNHIGDELFFGHGFNHTFWPEKHFVHAHNFYLQTLYEQGVVGLVALLAMMSIVCRSFWRNRSDTLVCLGFAMVVYIFVAMLSEIDHVITRPGIYWVIFWFPMAFTIGAVNRVRLEENQRSL